MGVPIFAKGLIREPKPKPPRKGYPEHPCTYIADTWVLKLLYENTLIQGPSIYYMGTWTLRVRKRALHR